MSTNALIAIQTEYETYNVNTINFDGYIDGVGRTLQNWWNDKEDVKELIDENEIRCLGEDFQNTEFYNRGLGVLRKRRDLTFDELCNQAGNFDYTYVFGNGMWQILSDRGIIEPF